MSEVWVFVGRTGMGKTCSMGFIADCMDLKIDKKTVYGWKPRVDLKHFHWFIQPFIEDITKQDENNKAAYPIGTTICLDEANVENPNNEWNSVKSQALAMALQTNRNFNYMILLTTPDLKSMAIGTRRRVNCIVQMIKKVKDYKGKGPMAMAKIEWVTYDHKTGKPYYKYHRTWKAEKIDTDENGRPIVIYRKKRIRRVWIPLLRDELRVPLDESKRLAQKEYYTKVRQDLEYLKNYIGADGKAIKKYALKDLQAIFKKPDGSVDFSEILIDSEKQNGKKIVFDLLVENKLIAAGYDGVTIRDNEKVIRWLKNELKCLSYARNVK